MAQLDKELFIEYIYYILLVLLQFYSGFIIQKTVIQINSRTALLNYLALQIKNFNCQNDIVKSTVNNFSTN